VSLLPRRLCTGLALALAMLLGACATAQPGGAGTAALPAAAGAAQQPEAAERQRLQRDPWGRFNRAVWAFNDGLDRALLKPVAQAYVALVPGAVRTGISNVFGTAEDAWSAVNQFLQGKPADGFQMGMRVASNLVFGLGGVLDPASEMGLERKSEDFGQTIGRWGVGPGPYVVLPLLGPRTLRDAAAWPVDSWASLSRQAETSELNRRRIGVLGVVDTRANLLAATRILGDVALDPYGFTRDAYLQRRRNQVYDGDPPEEPEEPDASAPAKP
jgi:phospholipid-binding lipoprotein MlaA